MPYDYWALDCRGMKFDADPYLKSALHFHCISCYDALTIF